MRKKTEVAVAAEQSLKRIDELVPHISADRVFALNHGIEWPYGNWKRERKALELAIRNENCSELKK